MLGENNKVVGYKRASNWFLIFILQVLPLRFQCPACFIVAEFCASFQSFPRPANSNCSFTKLLRCSDSSKQTTCRVSSPLTTSACDCSSLLFAAQVFSASTQSCQCPVGSTNCVAGDTLLASTAQALGVNLDGSNLVRQLLY